MSRSLEDSLTWKVALLGHTAGALPPSRLRQFVPELEAVVDATLQLPSISTQAWGSFVLTAMLAQLTEWGVPEFKSWCSDGALLPPPSGLQLWIDRRGVGWRPPK
jgi:hypothetical protein